MAIKFARLFPVGWPDWLGIDLPISTPELAGSTGEILLQPPLETRTLAQQMVQWSSAPESVCNPHLQLWASRYHLFSEVRGVSSGLQVGLGLRIGSSMHLTRPARTQVAAPAT